MNKSSLKISVPKLEIIINRWEECLQLTRRDHQLQKELQPQKLLRNQLPVWILLPNLKPLSLVELLQSSNQCLWWCKKMELVEAEKNLHKLSRKLWANLISFQELFTSLSREFPWTKNRSQMLCPISKSSKTRKQTKCKELVVIVRWTWVTHNPKEM